MNQGALDIGVGYNSILEFMNSGLFRYTPAQVYNSSTGTTPANYNIAANLLSEYSNVIVGAGGTSFPTGVDQAVLGVYTRITVAPNAQIGIPSLGCTIGGTSLDGSIISNSWALDGVGAVAQNGGIDVHILFLPRMQSAANTAGVYAPLKLIDAATDTAPSIAYTGIPASESVNIVTHLLTRGHPLITEAVRFQQRLNAWALWGAWRGHVADRYLEGAVRGNVLPPPLGLSLDQAVVRVADQPFDWTTIR
jgi:hypothetical protein